jgi:hypothetical protein
VLHEGDFKHLADIVVLRPLADVPAWQLPPPLNHED